MSNADWANKDFYKVLGVAKDADQAAIKKAYRKLARENHPDSKPGDKAAEERFKQVAEAYDVLGDAAKRKEYDDMRSMFAGAGGGGFPGGFPGGFGQGGGSAGGGFDLSDLFGDVFNRGGRRWLRRPHPGAPRRPRGRHRDRGDDPVRRVDRGHHDQPPAELGRPLPDLFGHRRQARHQAAHLPDLRGRRRRGQLGGRRLLDERDLPGVPRPPAGVRRVPARPATAAAAACPAGPCPRASPPGVKDGQKIRLKGKGAAGENGGPAGDLLVTVHVAVRTRSSGARATT